MSSLIYLIYSSPYLYTQATMDGRALSPTLSSASSASSSAPISPTTTTTSRFKAIKKKIKSTFKGKRGSLAEVNQVLKRSIEFEDELNKQSTTEAAPSETEQQSASILQFQTEFKGKRMDSGYQLNIYCPVV